MAFRVEVLEDLDARAPGASKYSRSFRRNAGAPGVEEAATAHGIKSKASESETSRRMVLSESVRDSKRINEIGRSNHFGFQPPNTDLAARLGMLPPFRAERHFRSGTRTHTARAPSRPVFLS